MIYVTIGARNHAEIVRADDALGALFASRGFPGTPSRQDPFPLVDDAYFNGGYNTLEHGSDPAGTIDAIQMELYSAIRFNTIQRKAFADSFVTVIRGYLQTNYFPGFASTTCRVTSAPENHLRTVSVYPNPVADELVVNGAALSVNISITDILGNLCVSIASVVLPARIDTHTLTSGTYRIVVRDDVGRVILSTSIVVIR